MKQKNKYINKIPAKKQKPLKKIRLELKNAMNEVKYSIAFQQSDERNGELEDKSLKFSSQKIKGQKKKKKKE